MLISATTFLLNFILQEHTSMQTLPFILTKVAKWKIRCTFLQSAHFIPQATFNLSSIRPLPLLYQTPTKFISRDNFLPLSSSNDFQLLRHWGMRLQYIILSPCLLFIPSYEVNVSQAASFESEQLHIEFRGLNWKYTLSECTLKQQETLVSAIRNLKIVVPKVANPTRSDFCSDYAWHRYYIRNDQIDRSSD